MSFAALLALALAGATSNHADASLIAPQLTAQSSELAGGRRSHPLETVAEANRKAIVEPDRLSFINAAQVYSWREGAIYRLFTAPGLVSDIALEAGEKLVSVAAGDTSRWVIGDTSSGSGAARRIHILVKPVLAGLATNLVITTDRRVYLLALKSSAKDGMIALSWTYPEDQLLALKAAQEAAAAAAPIAAGVAVDRLNFNYRIEGDRTTWTPLRAFDDGVRTFIEFPADVGSGEIPPLFVIGSSGKDELVNYRLSGRYYVVDRLFSAAELRIGEKRQLVVRIVRADPRPRGRGR